jgi:beta-lactam-binding protein with PASTA domain
MVAGMSVSQATSVLQAAQLRVMITSQGNSGVPPGTVIAQSPVAGTRLISGATITLTVAAGPGSSPTPAPGAAR